MRGAMGIRTPRPPGPGCLAGREAGEDAGDSVLACRREHPSYMQSSTAHFTEHRALAVLKTAKADVLAWDMASASRSFGTYFA